jgi:hypothetical protein
LKKYMSVRKKAIFINRLKYKIEWKSIIVSLLNVEMLFEAVKMFFMILYKIKGWFSIFASVWGYDESTGVYFIVNKLYNNGRVWILLIVDIIFIGLMIVWLLITNVKRKLLIIEHSSLQIMNFTYQEKELGDYAVKRLQINQYETLNNTDLSLQEKVTKIINEIEKFLPQILENVEKGYQVGYAGIANIPTTFMLGYELGDENKKWYFHKFRKDPDDDFHLLKSEDRQLIFEKNEKPNDLSRPGKILLLIQLTRPISSEDIQDVLEDNDYIIKYEIPKTINYDVVDSAQQINQYIEDIITYITKIQKNSNITEIKICVAASSSFIFGLGTKFSKTQNKDTVIFHFQNNTYPWGINVTKKIPVIIKGFQ